MSLRFHKFVSAARHNDIASKSMTTKTKILNNKALIEVLSTIGPTRKK